MKKPFFVPEDFNKFRYLCDGNYCGVGPDHKTPYHNPPCHMIECAEIANKKLESIPPQWEKTPTVLDYLDDTEPFDWDE